MTADADHPGCVVVGGGVAGLVAATALNERDVTTVVLESARTPGGRLETATRRDPLLGTAVWDVGAQFLTCRDDRFRSLVTGWLAAGVVTEWFRGLPPPDPPPAADEPHYRGVGGMATIADHLERGVDLRPSWPVERVEVVAGAWRVTGHEASDLDAGDEPGRSAAGPRIGADALILAVPVPVALDLLDAGATTLPGTVRRDLDRIDYEPTLAVLTVADGRTRLPDPGAWHGDGEPVAWLADNQRKGISDVPAVTVHAGGRFSRAHLDDEGDGWADDLVEAAAGIVGRPLRHTATRHWRHATPSPTHPERTVATAGAGAPLAFAGDAFAGPRVEGAALSGLAAADAILGLEP